MLNCLQSTKARAAKATFWERNIAIGPRLNRGIGITLNVDYCPSTVTIPE